MTSDRRQQLLAMIATVFEGFEGLPIEEELLLDALVHSTDRLRVVVEQSIADAARASCAGSA